MRLIRLRAPVPARQSELRRVDVGCGPGILTVPLAQLFEGVVGLDPAPAMIA